MPAAHALRALIEDYNPGASVRGLEAAAGLPSNYIAKYTRPSASTEQMPKMEVIKAIARAAHAPVEDVHHAMCEDLGYPTTGPALTSRERKMLSLCRRLADFAIDNLMAWAENMSIRREFLR